MNHPPRARPLRILARDFCPTLRAPIAPAGDIVTRVPVLVREPLGVRVQGMRKRIA